MSPSIRSFYGGPSVGLPHKLLASEEYLCSMYSMSLVMYCVLYAITERIAGWCRNLFISITCYPPSDPPTVDPPLGCLTSCIKECIVGWCRNLFISITDHDMSGRGVLFCIMSIWSGDVVSQFVMRWCNVSFPCSQSLYVGSISGFSLNWKYAKMLCPFIPFIQAPSIAVPILSTYFDLFLFGEL